MKLFKMLFFILMIASPNIAYSGELIKAGTTIKTDVYAFTVDEAQELKKTIEELEFENQKQKDLLEGYKELYNINESKTQTYLDLIDINNLQLSEYKNLHQLDLQRIKKLEKQQSVSSLERWGFFGLGIGFSIGTILIADKIDDATEGNLQ